MHCTLARKQPVQVQWLWCTEQCNQCVTIIHYECSWTTWVQVWSTGYFPCIESSETGGLEMMTMHCTALGIVWDCWESWSCKWPHALVRCPVWRRKGKSKCCRWNVGACSGQMYRKKVKVLCCIYAQARCTWKGSNPILELIHTNTFICDVKLPNINPMNRKNHVIILHLCGQS